MKPLQFLYTLFILLFFTNCSTPKSASLPPTNSYRLQQDKPTLTESLFKSKDSTLSEEDIQKLLNGKIVFPEAVRIAIFNYTPTANSYSNRYYGTYWDNEEYLHLQQDYMEAVVNGLKASKRVEKVILMPSILANERSSITQLREAAVRLQADALLIFHLQSDLYYKYKLFKKDQAKAFANCEALLMDIRTGMIPHADVLTHEELAEKQDTDFDVETMQKRAIKSAVLGVLEQITQGVAAFMEEK
ncbi:MAG: hypothetical protein R3E32_05985 [Chitinophagales bacterium]